MDLDDLKESIDKARQERIEQNKIQVEQDKIQLEQDKLKAEIESRNKEMAMKQQQFYIGIGVVITVALIVALAYVQGRKYNYKKKIKEENSR